MLASRTLPPILPRSSSPPPIATFINIPRRYVKSNMQENRDPSESQMEGVSPLQRQRKSSRIHEYRAASISSPVGRADGFRGPTSAPSSPRVVRKRTASSDDDVHRESFDSGDSPIDSRGPQSANSAGAGDMSQELSGHVCLCQPEPKIPRPRNAFILYRQHHQHAFPGLSNPEVSKIIGEQWNAESPEQKQIWTDLAQEEKAKHQEQYPDYRYQPRRASKLGSLPHTSVGHTAIDREKYRCPKCGGRSIKTPTSPFPSSPTQSLALPSISEELTPTSRYLPKMSNLSLESPAYRRRDLGPSNLSNIQVPPSAHREVPPMHSPDSSESKRRRYNYTSSSNGRRSDTPYFGHQRRESLPHLSQLRPSPPNTATMPPPPRTPREMRRGSADLSVLVPDQHDQSRSVEAMVMSVPYIVKVKVLGRITPPFKEPGPTSPAIQVRGAIIAIEGEDAAAVKGLGDWLNDFLGKAPEYHPRVDTPPRAPKPNRDVTFEDYLNLITEWHGKSKEMIQFITTPVAGSGSDSEKEKNTTSSSPEVKKKPVIILPWYQLHASDVYTSRIPIQDAYSPTDHWQWIATLWRGTVGPDLTIYVHSPDGKEAAQGGKAVELHEEVRCLTVRKEKGAKFSESALRRVGFEVGEWLRDVGGRTG